MRARFAAFLLLIFVRVGFFLVFLVLIIFVIELGVLAIVELLKLEGFAGEPVNGSCNQLLLDVLAQLVVKLKSLLNVLISLVVVIWGGTAVLWFITPETKGRSLPEIQRKLIQKKIKNGSR